MLDTPTREYDSGAIKRRLNRAKASERRGAKWLLKHDGPDPRFRPGGGIVTTTGRVGHVTGLQFDMLSRTYAGENKQMKVWAGLWGFWLKIVEKAKEQGKEPLLRIEPTNDGHAPTLHIITEDRHAELLGYEKVAKAAAPGIERFIEADPGPVMVNAIAGQQVGRGVRAYSKEQQVGSRRTSRRR